MKMSNSYQSVLGFSDSHSYLLSLTVEREKGKKEADNFLSLCGNSKQMTVNSQEFCVHSIADIICFLFGRGGQGRGT